MSNPHRGTVTLTIGETVYTLVFSINSLCEAETVLRRPYAAAVTELLMASQDANLLSLTTARALFWSALREKHAAVSLAEAGRLMGDAKPGPVIAATLEAFFAAFPPPEEGKADQNPQ